MYYWKVLATNTAGSSNYSSVRSFTIDPLGLPIIFEPPFLGPLLRWSPIDGATGYDIYSTDDPYGTYTFEAHVSTNEYEITFDQSKRFYYVVATN